MKTYSQKPAEIQREWYEVDATGMPLGRLATRVAALLTGKGKPTFTPHIDGGDYVVVVNAEKVVLTGRKGEEWRYRHTGYPGGIKAKTKADLLRDDPIQAVEHAIAGMIPRNKLHKDRMARLRVFSNGEHEHTAQQPKKVEF
jgi:large subunit ribosomal protein L13